MISFEDRMALVRAGYTASQIAEFDNVSDQAAQPVPDQAPQEQAPQEQAPQEQAPQEQAPQEQTQPSDFASMMQSINNSMAAILAAMQAQNIKNADMGTPVKETPGDILAKLLNP